MENVRFMIVCDRAASDSLSAGLGRVGVSEPRTSEVRGLGGDVVNFVIAGTVAVKATTALLDLVIVAIKLRNTIRTLKIGEKEITNPTEQDVEKLKEQVAS